MGLLDLLGFNKLPTGVAGSTLVLADATTLARADALLVALQARFGNVAVAQLGSVDYRGSLPQIELSADSALERLKKIRPQRLIVLGLDGSHANLVQAADCPAWWINAHDAAATQAGCRAVTTAQAGLSGAQQTGDPLAGIEQLPTLVNDPTLCARLK